MESLLKLSFAFFQLTIFLQGVCSTSTCDLNSIRVTQGITEKRVAGKPEYEVEVSNWCACAQANLKLRCKGFQTVEPVNPALMKQEGDFCIINSGKPVKQGAAIRFRYAFDKTFDFVPATSTVQCR